MIRQHPDRFAFLGGGALLNSISQKREQGQVDEDDRRLFIANAEMIVKAGAAGFGEMAAEHYGIAKFDSFHPYESAPPDHELFLLLADLAAKYDLPIDLHMEPIPEDMALPERPGLKSPPNPLQLKANLQAFERLLDHNRATKIVWAHAGWDITGTRDIKLMRQLLRRHPNLYMNIKIAKSGAGHSKPLMPDGRLKESWLTLLAEFSDRFMIGTDMFYAGDDAWGGGPSPASGLTDLPIRLLEQLPADLAGKVAYENAIRLYKLDGKSQ